MPLPLAVAAFTAQRSNSRTESGGLDGGDFGLQQHHIPHGRAIVRGYALALLEYGLVQTGQIQKMLVIRVGAGKANLGRFRHVFDGFIKRCHHAFCCLAVVADARGDLALQCCFSLVKTVSPHRPVAILQSPLVRNA